MIVNKNEKKIVLKICENANYLLDYSTKQLLSFHLSHTFHSFHKCI